MRFKLLAATASVAAPLAAQAVPVRYVAPLVPANGNPVAGVVGSTLDGTVLTSRVTATGLQGPQQLPHIRSRFDAAGNPVDTGPPPPPVPPNGNVNLRDGVVNPLEAKSAIGPVILSLVLHGEGVQAELLPADSAGGTLVYLSVFDLSLASFEPIPDPSDKNRVDIVPPATDPRFTLAALLPLDFRVFDMHGGAAPVTASPTDFLIPRPLGSTSPPGAFDLNLPAASGVIAPAAVPGPAALGVVGLGLLGLVALRAKPVGAPVRAAA